MVLGHQDAGAVLDHQDARVDVHVVVQVHVPAPLERRRRLLRVARHALQVQRVVVREERPDHGREDRHRGRGVEREHGAAAAEVVEPRDARALEREADAPAGRGERPAGERGGADARRAAEDLDDPVRAGARAETLAGRERRRPRTAARHPAGARFVRADRDLLRRGVVPHLDVRVRRAGALELQAQHVRARGAGRAEHRVGLLVGAEHAAVPDEAAVERAALERAVGDRDRAAVGEPGRSGRAVGAVEVVEHDGGREREVLADLDHDRGGVERPGRVGDREHRDVRAGGGIGVHGIRLRRALAVAEAPGKGQRVAVGVRGAGGRERDLERLDAHGGLGRRGRDRRLVAHDRSGVADAPHLARVDRDVVEVAAHRVRFQVHGPGHGFAERLGPRELVVRIHAQDADPSERELDVEILVPVGGRVLRAGVERPGDRGAADRPGRHAERRVAVRPVGGGIRQRARVRRAADRRAAGTRGRQGLVVAPRLRALVAGPAEVDAGRLEDVEVLVVGPAHVADVERARVAVGGIRRAGAGTDHDAIRVAQAVRPDARALRERVAVPVRIARVAVAVRGVDPEDLAREAAERLGAERADVLGRVGLARPEGVGVQPAAVGGVELRALARAEEQAAVPAELHRADRVRGRGAQDALRPVRAEEHRAGREVERVRVARAHLVAHEPPERVVIVVHAVGVRVHRVGQVEVAVGGEVRVHREADRASIGAAEHLGLAVPHGHRVAHAVLRHPQPPALLERQHSPVGKETDPHRDVEVKARHGVLHDEVGRHLERVRGRRGRPGERERGQRQRGERGAGGAAERAVHGGGCRAGGGAGARDAVTQGGPLGKDGDRGVQGVRAAPACSGAAILPCARGALASVFSHGGRARCISHARRAECGPRAVRASGNPRPRGRRGLAPRDFPVDSRVPPAYIARHVVARMVRAPVRRKE